MKLTYQIFAKPVVYGNTANRKLVVEVNGGEIANNSYFYSYESFGEYTFVEGDEVLVSLTELDSKGKENATTSIEFIAEKNAVIPKDNILYVNFVKEEQEEVEEKDDNDLLNVWKKSYGS